MKERSKPWYEEQKRQLRMDPRLDDRLWVKKLAHIYGVSVCFITRLRREQKAG